MLLWRQSISSSYHPMSQGLLDRFNRTMKAYLSKTLKAEEESCSDTVLDRVQFAYNVSVDGSTLVSPIELV